MVIPPGYYASTLLANRASLVKFFVDIAKASPVPVIVYNFPGVSGGIDLDSDLIIDVVKAHPNRQASFAGRRRRTKVYVWMKCREDSSLDNRNPLCKRTLGEIQSMNLAIQGEARNVAAHLDLSKDRWVLVGIYG